MDRITIMFMQESSTFKYILQCGHTAIGISDDGYAMRIKKADSRKINTKQVVEANSEIGSVYLGLDGYLNTVGSGSKCDIAHGVVDAIKSVAAITR